jgi:hypothetical protein
MEKLAKSPTLGSTPAMIEKAIASGIAEPLRAVVGE